MILLYRNEHFQGILTNKCKRASTFLIKIALNLNKFRSLGPFLTRIIPKVVDEAHFSCNLKFARFSKQIMNI